jgi:hypothetical protein
MPYRLRGASAPEVGSLQEYPKDEGYNPARSNPPASRARTEFLGKAQDCKLLVFSYNCFIWLFRLLKQYKFFTQN